MKLSQIYAMMGWPLYVWKTKTLPPAPIAHSIPFDDLVRSVKQHATEVPKKSMTDEDFKERCAAFDDRYSSLKQGEALGKLSPDELSELHSMETGYGFGLYSSYASEHERLGQRLAYLP